MNVMCIEGGEGKKDYIFGKEVWNCNNLKHAILLIMHRSQHAVLFINYAVWVSLCASTSHSYSVVCWLPFGEDSSPPSGRYCLCLLRLRRGEHSNYKKSEISRLSSRSLFLKVSIMVLQLHHQHLTVEYFQPSHVLPGKILLSWCVAKSLKDFSFCETCQLIKVHYGLQVKRSCDESHWLLKTFYADFHSVEHQPRLLDHPWEESSWIQPPKQHS